MTPAPTPLTEAEIAQLQSLLEALPRPMQPLDVGMLDGFLCGVLLQPKRPPESDWFPHVLDEEGRRLPRGVDSAPLHALVLRRLAELDAAIQRREWFDPWVWELEEDTDPSDTVLPWVTGFAAACALFPRLTELDNPALLEPLATLFMHLDPQDLEDADELLAEIETLEPPATLDEAVESLVRSTLLMADVSRPLRKTETKKPPARHPAGPSVRKSGTAPSRRR